MIDTEGPLDEQEKQDAISAGESKPWLDMLRDAEKAFEFYQSKCDNIDKLYADLQRQANPARDREFAIFWANVEVLGPSIYARPPVPVVVPQFNDRRPVPRVASELLERATTVAFRIEHIDHTMRLVRDDLNMAARGAAWIRDDEDSPFGFCIEHKDRKDFLHEPARNWREVNWVACASYPDRKAFKKRFPNAPINDVAFEINKDAKELHATDDTKKAKVWEIWHRAENKVVWVTDGVSEVLDESEPYFKLEGFFPCPRPAFGTLQRRSLIPVPDMLFYKDQLEEINELTGRIAALAEALRVRGFYPAGSGEIGDAIEAAINTADNRKIMVPISNWAAFGSGGAKDMIVWLPIDMVAQTITQLVELRKQVIEDVYQITGLSDIMRGSTEASETATAQKLKSEYGSVRVRDKQGELVRFARDIARIAAEVMAESVPIKTLLDMTQMDIPHDAQIKQQMAGLTQQIAHIEAEIEKAHADPQVRQMAQQAPDKAQQIMGAAQGQIATLQQQMQKVAQTPTIEKVMALLKEQKLRPFVLDIETDSTIQPNEDAEKQRRAEFLQALAAAMQQMAPMVQGNPKTAVFAGEVLKFALAPFRAGRELEQAIDDFIEQMEAQSGQQQPNPDAMQARADAQNEAERIKIEGARLQFDQQKSAGEQQINLRKLELDAQVKQAQNESDVNLRWRIAQLQSLTQIEVARISAKNDSDSQAVSAELEAALHISEQQHEAAMQGQEQAHEQQMAEMDQAHQADMAAQQQAAEAAQPQAGA